MHMDRFPVIFGEGAQRAGGVNTDPFDYVWFLCLKPFREIKTFR